jgi:hypothetical protein
MLQVTDYSSYAVRFGIFPPETHLQLVFRMDEVRNENDQSISKHSETFSRPISSHVFGADAVGGVCHLVTSLPSADLIHRQGQEQHPMEKFETGVMHYEQRMPPEEFAPCPSYDRDGR